MDSHHVGNTIFGIVAAVCIVVAGIALSMDMRPDLEGKRIIETARVWAGR